MKLSLFVKLLSNTYDDVRDQVVWALANIAGDSPSHRDLVLESGAMEPLLRHLKIQGTKIRMTRNATWTLMNLCRGKPPPSFDMVKAAIPTLAELILTSDQDEKILEDSCWTLSYIFDGPNDKSQAIIEASICQRLNDLLMNPSPSVQYAALKAVGNILAGNDEQKQLIIKHNVIPGLLALLYSPKNVIEKKAWTIFKQLVIERSAAS